MSSQQSSMPSKVLVSDFDGTMTQHDFYKLAIELLMPPETPDYWVEYRAGTITHFEALRRYFAAIRATDEEVLAVMSIGSCGNLSQPKSTHESGCDGEQRDRIPAA